MGLFRKKEKDKVDKKIRVAHITFKREQRTSSFMAPLDQIVTKVMPKLTSGDRITLVVEEMMQSEYDAIPEDRLWEI